MAVYLAAQLPPTGIGSSAGLAVQPDGKYLWAGEAKIVTVGYSENDSAGATGVAFVRYLGQ